MQNKCNGCDSGFVSLDGSWGSVNWNCGNCGCNNCGCDTCSNCGWNRCGCNNGGAVVYTNACRNRNNDGCDDCQKENRQRRNDSCECEKEKRMGGRNGKYPTYGSRSLYAECCDDNTSVRDFSCGCKDSSHSRQNRSKDCDKCNDCSGGAYANQNRSKDCDKCGNNGMNYAQNRGNGCDKCDECENANYAYQNRSKDCDKRDHNKDGNCSRSRKNKGVGIVWAKEQELDQVFESESALRSGTLFPELHKPMNGYCPGECNCQTDEQAAAFAAWELRLYLNTHPNDKQALALFRKLCEETDDPNYATSFLKEKDCTSGWDWTDDPWPWECRPCGK